MINKSHRIFVAGGAGFIGSHLVDVFLKQDCTKVTVYDNLSDGDKEHISHHMPKENFEFIENDLNNFNELKHAMQGHDIVFHFAANTDNRNEAELPTDLQLKENIQNTYNVLESMRLNKVRNLVFPSSATVYGDSHKPFAESFGPLLPTSLYGASKLTGEALISAFHYLFGINAWIFRFSNIVGSRMGHGVIFDFVKKLRKNPVSLEILGDGKQRKPFVHVDECIEAMLFTLNALEEGLHLFNIGCSNSTRVDNIAKIIVREMGLSGVKYRCTGGKRGWINDVPILRFNINKLKKLGWSTHLSSDQAVQRATRELLKEI